MKKNLYIILFVLVLTLKSTTGFSTTHTITTSGLMFSPDSVSAFVGDTVIFTLSSNHNAHEVSQSTWLANGTTSNGGFQVPFGGGTTVVTQVKTYYYVCTNHASSGMKGRIFVTNPVGISLDAISIQSLEIFPNPVSTSLTIISHLPNGKENQLHITDLIGKCLYEKVNISSVESVDVSEFPSGIYFVGIKSGDLDLKKRLIISR